VKLRNPLSGGDVYLGRFAEGDGGAGGAGGGGDGDAAAKAKAEADAAAKAAAGSGDSEAVAKLKSENEALRANVEKLYAETRSRKDALSGYRDPTSGELIDPEAFRKWQAEQADADRRKAEEKGEFDKLLQLERDKTAAAVKAAETLTSQWHGEKIGNALLAAAAELNALPQAMAAENGTPSQVVALYAAQFEVAEGGAVAHRTRKDDNGNPLSVKAFLEEVKSGSGANLFASMMKPGSGAGAGGAGDGTIVRIPRGASNRVALQEQADKDGHQVVYID
jgi:hypothetical protein